MMDLNENNGRKRVKFLAVVIVSLSVLFLSSCDGLMTGDYKYFDSKLRGTWISNDAGLYSGTLNITYDKIIIDGYGEDWTSMVGDDSKRPFKDLPKGVEITGYSEKGETITGYSEEGQIFIMYGEAALNGIPYIYTEVGSYPQRYKLLEFSFGGRKEILQCKMDL